MYDYHLSMLNIMLEKYKALTHERVNRQLVFITMLSNYYRYADIVSLAKSFHHSKRLKVAAPKSVQSRVKISSALLGIKQEEYIGAVMMLWFSMRGIKNPTLSG